MPVSSKRRTAAHRPAARRRRFRHDDLVAVDLFSGFGGLTEGIKRAGFTTIMAANHNEYKVKVHEANHPEAEHWIADLINPESADYHSARDLPAADLLVAGVTCFAADALVLTRRGLTPIEEVRIGDEVWTHRARWRPVVDTSAVERPTIAVNATTPITCTPDHPFIAATAERAYQVRRKYQPLDGARCFECGGPAPQFRATSTARLFCSRACNQAASKRRALPVLSEPSETRADSLAGKWVGTPILGHDGTELPPIPDMGPVTTDNAWTLGRWVGDGWASRRSERGDAWSRITICSSHAEADSLAKELAARTDLPWNRTGQRTTDTFHVDRRQLADFIVEQFGQGAAGKFVPTWLLFAPEDIRRSFVEGYLSADGHTNRDGLRVQATSVSKRLAVGIRILLTSLGYFTSILRQQRKLQSVIEGRTVNQRPSWIVTGYLCRERRPKHRDADGYRWGAARGTVKAGDTVTVYNLTVDEDHTYVVDGVLVHNCTNHSGANTQKAYAQRMSLFDLDDPDFDARVTRSERDRATANCVLHYSERHHPRMILIECTTELTSWGPAIPGRPKVGDGTTYRWWLSQFKNLGYDHKVMYLNSQFFDVAQSRDRIYIAFWDKTLPAPDLEHRPAAWCGRCDEVMPAVWSWKTGIPPTGTVRYGTQYNYRCPRCRSEVIPAMAPLISVLDLTNLGTRIGDKPAKKHKDGSTGPLALATLARAERCRQRFAEFPAIIMPAKSARSSERHPWQPMATQTSQQEAALLSTGALTGSVIAAHRHNGDGAHISKPMNTVTSTHEKAVVFAAVNNFQGAPRGVDDALPTQGGSETLGLMTAGVMPNRENAVSRSLGRSTATVVGNAAGGGLGLLSSGIIPFRRNTVPTTHAEPMPAVTSEQIPGLLTAAGSIKNNGPIDQAQYRAHPVSDPLGTLVASTSNQAMLFSGWDRHDGTAPARSEWQAALADLKLEDCFFRMLGSHEVGRGCGFDVDFPDYQGSFVVWGSARDQVDGFGNAVSPAVGAWIGARLRAALNAEELVMA